MREANQIEKTVRYNKIKFDMAVRIKQATNKGEFENQTIKKIELKKMLPSFTEFHQEQRDKRIAEERAKS